MSWDLLLSHWSGPYRFSAASAPAVAEAESGLVLRTVHYPQELLGAVTDSRCASFMDLWFVIVPVATAEVHFSRTPKAVDVSAWGAPQWN